MQKKYLKKSNKNYIDLFYENSIKLNEGIFRIKLLKYNFVETRLQYILDFSIIKSQTEYFLKIPALKKYTINVRKSYDKKKFNFKYAELIQFSDYNIDTYFYFLISHAQLAHYLAINNYEL